MTTLLFNPRDKSLRKITSACATRLLRNGALTLDQYIEREALSIANIEGIPHRLRTRALRLVKKVQDGRR